MKAVRTILAITAVLATGGGLFAAQAIADPATPVPLPAATTSAAVRGGGLGLGWFYGVLTEKQRDCLAGAAVQRPAGRLSDAEASQLRAAVDAALAKCEVTVPARLAGRERFGFGWAALSTTQQQCLADVELTRPAGRLTAEQRAALRQSRITAIRGCVAR